MCRKTLWPILLLFCLPLAAQETPEAFSGRYRLLVSRFGYSGVGVETLLDKWEKAFPDDIDMLTGKFMFYFSKSQTATVEQLPKARYLGQEPTFSLKDSLGRPVNYFQVTKYDDELFGTALKYMDKAIMRRPHALDLRQAKITAYMAYEGESPDLATTEIISLIDYHFSQKPPWTHPDTEKADQDFFDATIQELCFTFFRSGCYGAFRAVSERMLKYAPRNILFLDNVGTWYLVAERDFGQALKSYKKVLKIKKDDLTAIKNVILLAKNSGDARLEKKYLGELVKYSGDEEEKKTAAARMQAL